MQTRLLVEGEEDDRTVNRTILQHSSFRVDEASNSNVNPRRIPVPRETAIANLSPRIEFRVSVHASYARG